VESREFIAAVVEQDLAAGEIIGEGSTTSMNADKGVYLPDVRGERRDAAVRFLNGASLEVEEESEESFAANGDYVTDRTLREVG
jgi:beta-lactam-binding protein with PASTA domain